MPSRASTRARPWCPRPRRCPCRGRGSASARPRGPRDDVLLRLGAQSSHRSATRQPLVPLGGIAIDAVHDGPSDHPHSTPGRRSRTSAARCQSEPLDDRRAEARGSRRAMERAARPSRKSPAGAAAEDSASARSSSASSFGGSFAHSSSNSTRHLPSSACSSLSLARKVRPERPRKPVTAFSVRPTPGSSPASREWRSDSISSFATDTGSVLLGLLLPDHEAAAGILARPARVALAVLGDLAPADRAGPELGPLDLHALELVELLHRLAGELRDVAT